MTIADISPQDEITSAAIRGDEEAFSALYDLLSVRVFNFVLRSVHERSTAEDICQEIWLKAHREIRSLKSPQALRTWLFRMASRACIDYSRSRAYRERGSPEITEEMMEAPADEPEAVALRQRDLRAMWEALAALPQRQSMALYLKQVDGYNYDEIGRILGCPRSAVETLLFRARHGLSRTRERFQADPKASCRMIGATMSVVLDKEGTPIQERAVNMHLSECRPCRDELGGMKRGVASYALLPMLPVGGQALSAALAGGTVGAGAGFGISRLVGLLLVKGQASGLAALTVGAMATAGVAGATTGALPSPLEGIGVVEEVGTAVRNATIGGGDSDDAAELKMLESDDLSNAIQNQGGGGLASQQPQLPLPPAGPLQGGSTGGSLEELTGLTEVLQGATSGLFEGLNPLLTYVNQTLSGLQDPLATVEQLLTDPGAMLREITENTTKALNATTQNTTALLNETTQDTTTLLNGTTQDTTTALDGTVDQTTDLVDGLLGPNQVTDSLDQTTNQTTDVVDTTVGGATGLVDETVGGATGLVDETVGGLTETLDDLTETLDEILPPLLPTPAPEEEEPPPEEDPPLVCTLLPILCP
jgi:RNA polymerase sigma-70 factor (ECF subfamily)